MRSVRTKLVHLIFNDTLLSGEGLTACLWGTPDRLEILREASEAGAYPTCLACLYKTGSINPVVRSWIRLVWAGRVSPARSRR